MLPSIEPSEVGITGLLWLFLSYGYILYYAANLIGEGSELLLLVPSMAGLVGGVVLPLLGAVPDGAIILFSGLSPDLEQAQETLAVGVGALAGSTIMLLTIPFALSIFSGRVDLLEPDYKTANYVVKPKLTHKTSIMHALKSSGVALSEAVQHGGVLMSLTCIPYALIQVPAWFIHDPNEDIGRAEHLWSFIGFLVCLIGLFIYMSKQLQLSKQGQDRDKRIDIMKKVLKDGKMSLSGMIASEIHYAESNEQHEYELHEYNNETTNNDGRAESLIVSNDNMHSSEDQQQHTADYPSQKVAELLAELVGDGFRSYDSDGNGRLDRQETAVFFSDFHESITQQEMDALFAKYDRDASGTIDFHEFIGLAYSLIKDQEKKQHNSHNHSSADNISLRNVDDAIVRERNQTAIAENAFSETPEGEEEEMPEQFTDLSPDEQQKAIKTRAFLMLLAGTVLVLLFSDPMVDVFAEIGSRTGIPPFYVSFVLAPLASNASELLSTTYYAAKKTRKTITISLTALEGAACMNNTFCLSIFMALIYFRGVAWQYTAETLAIVVVELIVCLIVQRQTLSCFHGILLLLLFPLSIVLVAGMEALGFD